MSSKPQTSTQSKTPISGDQSNLFSNIWGQTNAAVNNATSQPIPQNTVAGATPAQRSGAQQMLDIAPTLGAGAPGTMDLVNKISSGYFMNPQNDPNFQGAVEAALYPGYMDLTTKVLPHVQDASLRASGGGTGPAAYGGVGGGSPQDKLTENVLRDWTTGAQNTGRTMAENAYRTGMSLIPQIPGLAQSGTTQALTPAAVTSAAGGMQQGFEQNELQNLINRYFMQGQGPLGFLSTAAQIGGAGGFGNQTTTGPAPNVPAQWLQGLTGGAGTINSLFGAGPGGAPSAISNLGTTLGSLGTGLMNGLGTAASWLPFI